MCVMEKEEKSYDGYIPIITRKEAAKVKVKEILYIETELRVVNIYTNSRVYRFYGKLIDVMKYLNCNFYRCHKSCIVNLEKIARMENGIFYFYGGMTLRVGQNTYQRTRSYFKKFLKQNTKVD
ncbi:MAG: LytTR family DNA-binding domain-containing protein [Bacillota bacterium]